MNQGKERIRLLRERMEERGIDAYLVPTADFHESEYVGEHFACRSYLTGFTGSAGTALVMKDWAGVWTDGRYFVQAAAQLEGSGVTLMKMGVAGVPSLEEYLEQHLPDQGVLGFDGRVVNGRLGEDLAAALAPRGICLAADGDLVGEIWQDRPGLPANPVWILEEQYAGQSAAHKLAQLRQDMEKLHAGVHILDRKSVV